MTKAEFLASVDKTIRNLDVRKVAEMGFDQGWSEGYNAAFRRAEEIYAQIIGLSVPKEKVEP